MILAFQPKKIYNSKSPVEWNLYDDKKMFIQMYIFNGNDMEF